jgi:hypothetical protein
VDATLFTNLEITITGVDPLDDTSSQVWQTAHADWYVNFYKDQQPLFGIFNVDTTIAFVSQDPPRTQRRGLSGSRNLQNQQLKLIYNQTISYENTSSTTLSTQGVITQALASDTARAGYTAQLKATDDNAFADITGVSGVSQGGQGGGGGEDDGGLSTGAIVGIAVGGAAGLVLLGGALYMATHRGDGGYEKSAGDHPPSSLQLGGGDDVSTLNDPGKSSRRAADSLGGYGDQR